MDFTGLFEIQGMLFSIMILGLLLKKKGVIKEQSQELLTDLVVYVTLRAASFVPLRSSLIMRSWSIA